MKKILLSLAFLMGFVGSALANTGGVAWDKAPVRTNDMAALQHGAKLFVNYCLNCHSASFVRYNRLKDIGSTDQQIKDNLLFTGEKVGNMMQSNISPADAKAWFGKTPPDLSLVARSRAGSGGPGRDYLYTFLRGFYKDDTRPTGWNNLVFPNVGMPHVLWELQGEREPIHTEVESHGEKSHVITGFKQVTPGTMNQKDYDNAIADLVAYMEWMAEPARNTRVRLGVWVLMFLLGFMVIAWRLNASFWKDVK